jgi:hypothetical protein
VSLSGFASNTYSQFGEDGIIAEIFTRIEPRTHHCVEFGAANGISCSNTAALWHDEWTAVLIEAETALYVELCDVVEDFDNVTPVQLAVQPSGPDSIDVLLRGQARVDFMSIDVDGDDYAIWEAMECQPRVISIEYNQSVPPGVELRQANRGDCFGASATSLLRLGQSKGYDLVAMTEGNLIFVDAHETFEHFTKIGVEEDFDTAALTYVVTDNQGRPAIVGRPPWGWHHETYLGETIGAEVTRLPIAPSEVFESYAERYGAIKVDYLTINLIDDRPEYAVHERLADLLTRPVVGIDITNIGVHELDQVAWVPDCAADHGYRCHMHPGLIVLVRND